MAIFMDKPANGGWVHLLSDIPGEAGSSELHAFAELIGLKKRWVHAPSSYAEHYDIRDTYVESARAAGVKLIERRKLVEILRRKRKVMGPRRRRQRVRSKGTSLPER